MLPAPRSAICILALVEGRSVAARISGRLDYGLARSIQELVARHPDALRVRLECSGVTALDPIGARVLAQALAVHCARGVRVELLGLPAALRLRLGRHPLARFAEADDELVFYDPEQDGQPDLPASRH